MNVDHTEPSPEFSLTDGGPGAAFMKRLRLVHPELGAQSARIALILGGLTWLPLFVLCVLGGVAFAGVTIPFFYDIATHTRFLFAVPMLVLADIPIGTRLREVVRHFVAAHLVREDGRAQFGEIILDGLRFRDSRAAELVVLGLAYVATFNALSGFSFQGQRIWFRAVPGGGLTPAED